MNIIIKKKSVIITLIILIIVGILGFYINSISIQNSRKEVFNYFKSTDEWRGGLVAQYFFEEEPRHELILVKNTFNEHIYSLVYGYDEEIENQQIRVYNFYMKRKVNSIDYYGENFLTNNISGLTFDEVVEIVSQQDITTDFEGKEKYNITNNAPLTGDQIKRNLEPDKYSEYLKEQEVRYKRLEVAGTEERLEIFYLFKLELEEYIRTGIFTPTGDEIGTGALSGYKIQLEEVNQEISKLEAEIENEE